MQDHAVPQNITGFEFKLVGFLTLRQFLYLAGAGIIVFILFVSTGSFLKWVLITPIVLLALAIAFMPINGMSFDKWLLLFIHAISSPARRVWFKEPKVISFLAPEFSYYLRRSVAVKPVPVSDRTRLQTFIAQISYPRKTDQLDIFEPRRFSSLDFGPMAQLPASTFAPPVPSTPVPQGGSEPQETWFLAESTAPETAAETISEQERPLKRRAHK